MISGNGRLEPDIDEPNVRSGRPVAALLSDFAGETSTLVRQEIALFKASSVWAWEPATAVSSCWRTCASSSARECCAVWANCAMAARA